MWSFLARLRERKLAHWAIAYLAGAWLLLQVLTQLRNPQHSGVVTTRRIQ